MSKREREKSKAGGWFYRDQSYLICRRENNNNNGSKRNAEEEEEEEESEQARTEPLLLALVLHHNLLYVFQNLPRPRYEIAHICHMRHTLAVRVADCVLQSMETHTVGIAAAGDGVEDCTSDRKHSCIL